MTDEAPTRLKLNIAAFRAIAAAVTEAEIGGEVASVTISSVKPDLQLMADAVAVELTSSDGKGGERSSSDLDRRRRRPCRRPPRGPAREPEQD